ncbi:MAG TPA: tRNA (N6-isopentenyl adenosine(37)-C2)-methylthiotransferase MiaB [Cryobacterium sp.]|nr:tRNA (N6-isopentenyl adenosine(37)-C2)-methylthiotransferase MiaB [Cryobacterium sp.]
MTRSTAMPPFSSAETLDPQQSALRTSDLSTSDRGASPRRAPPRIAPSEAAHDAEGRARTYEVRTFGCQMNVHDSERLSGSLEAAGYVPAVDEEADIVVLNTCAVRENADNKLYGNLGHLASVKRRHEGMQIAVGGCLAQKDKDVILKKAPWVDVVFGTHNMGSLPSMLERARHNGEAQLEILDSLETFPSTLPTKRDSSYSGWVSISVGCNNTCTFCIVPALRGKEKDRRPGEILAEIQALVDDGAIEVTLLGQNVNSYGVEFGDRLAFGKLLRAAGQIEGLERIRFTSPHPAAFTDDVIDAMADTPSVMPQLHMPLQSGSDRILKAMRRSYRSGRFLGILDRVRAQMPHAAISTDIIVGFPGETEEDFQETLRVVELARFATAFTFQYSIRPGTPAATMPDQVPKQVVQDRYERLAALQERISWEENQTVVGREVELLVANGEGRKDSDTHRLSGRAPDSRLVHFDVPAGSELPRPGDLVTVTVTQAAPFHLIADSVDGAPLRIRRTIAGDAWDRLEAESCGVPSHGAASGGAGSVSLGLPTLRPSTLRVGPPAATGSSTTPIYDVTDGER